MVVIDIVCLMYVWVDQYQLYFVVLKYVLKNWISLLQENCFFILCEYVYVMGNSLGVFYKYWQVFCEFFCL